MIDTILGTKVEMGQSFTSFRRRVPKTVVRVGPNVVVQAKTLEKDGYQALQLGFSTRKIKRITKPLRGHLKGAAGEKTAPRFLREVKTSERLAVGDVIKPSEVFKAGDLVSVTGVSKGKGFAGVVKRHHFAGGPRTHGQSDRERAPGSIGQGTTPGRVYKGKRMAGRMGTERVTVKNLMVLSVDDEKGTLELSGPVPGSRGTLLMIKKIGENKRSLSSNKKFEGLYEAEKAKGPEPVERVEDVEKETNGNKE